MAQISILSVICLAFPVAGYAVFEQGFDRVAVANILASVYAFGLYALFLTPWWPLKSLKDLRPFERLQKMVFVWFFLTYATHLSWELFWLILHDQIVLAKDQAWAYVWWAYIDGGDYRYASDDPSLWMMEILSVVNGVIGSTGLYLWFKKTDLRRLAVYLFMTTAVVHLYATSLYFGSEIVAGFPNVNTDSFYDIGVKFILANSPWLVFPWFVIYWGFHVLEDHRS